jgi:putative oxidoreductase
VIVTPSINGGDAAILFCLIFLYLFAVGPATWSFDEMRNPGRGERISVRPA